MMTSVAVIVGGSDQVWLEVEQARAICAAANRSATYYICNDMIAKFPEPAVGVTLHPHKIKLDRWIAERTANRYPPLTQLWCHQAHPSVTHRAFNLTGSVGLYALRIAIQCGHKQNVLCGIPMEKTGNHFVRQRPWDACELFKPEWRKHIASLKETTRSFGGWTAEMLGEPDAEFLKT